MSETMDRNKMDQLFSNDDTTLDRIDEHSYLVSFNNQQQKIKFHSEKPALIDIHTELLHIKENLLINKGFIHIKEYVVDGYECRCHEYKNLLNDQEIDINKHSFDYKLEF